MADWGILKFQSFKNQTWETLTDGQWKSLDNLYTHYVNSKKGIYGKLATGVGVALIPFSGGASMAIVAAGLTVAGGNKAVKRNDKYYIIKVVNELDHTSIDEFGICLRRLREKLIDHGGCPQELPAKFQ